MADATLSILIKAKNDASAIFKDVEKDASSLGSKMGTALKAGGLIAAAGIGAAGFALVGFVKQAAEEQVGIEKLKQSVTNTGLVYADYAKQIDATVRAGEKLAFSDDDVRGSLGALTTATGSLTEATSRQRIAMDLARGTGMDLATASKLVGKVSEENTQVLKRYGITLKDGASEQEALAEIQKRFAGQSETFAATATAKWQIFNNQMDNIKESIGGALLPVVTQLGTALGDFLTRHQADIDRFSQMMAEKIPEGIEAIKSRLLVLLPLAREVFEGWRTVLEAVVPKMVEFGQFIADHKPLLIAFGIAAAAAVAILFTIPVAIAAVVIAVGLLADHWDEIKAKTLEVWGEIATFIDERLGFLKAIVVDAFSIIKTEIVTGFTLIRDIVKIVMAVVQGDWGAAWEGIKQLGKDGVEGIVNDIRAKLALLADIFGGAMIGAYAAILTVWDEIRAWFADLPFAITSAIGDLYGVLLEFAKNAIQGFIDGIWEKATAVGDAITGVIGGAIAKGRELLHINSPSLVFREMGLSAMEGFQLGIEAGSGSLFTSIDNIVGQVISRIAAAKAAVANATSGDSGGDVNSDYGQREIGNEQRAQRVGGRTRDEWKYIFGASGIPASEYNAKLKEMFGYERGTNYVPQTGPAWLHKGEAVIPASQNTGGRGWTNNGTVIIQLPNVRQSNDVARELDRYFRGVA